MIHPIADCQFWQWWQSWQSLPVLVRSGPVLLPSVALYDLRRIGVGIHDHPEPADHHLLPTLVAPLYFHVGIRVVRVVDGIVKVRGALHAGSFRQRDGLGLVVS